jgi:hypothetical protein
MPSLIATNRYLQNPKRRRQMIAENVYDSSLFEGVVGLVKPRAQKKNQRSASRRRRIASSKKRASGV